MKLGYTILYVADVSRTMMFYSRAFQLEKKFLHESGDYGELDTGQTTLAFVSHELALSNDVGFRKSEAGQCNQMEIAFIASDVDAAFNCALSAGATEVMKPSKKPWGQTVSYVRDLNGFLVEICSAVQG